MLIVKKNKKMSNLNKLIDPNILLPNYKLWKTNDGLILELSEMEDGHLINTIKMLYNNILFPPIPLSDDYIRWSFGNLDKTDAIYYILNMLQELEDRNSNCNLKELILKSIKKLEEYKQIFE
jgi:hypothetical protein